MLVFKFHALGNFAGMKRRGKFQQLMTGLSTVEAWQRTRYITDK